MKWQEGYAYAFERDEDAFFIYGYDADTRIGLLWRASGVTLPLDFGQCEKLISSGTASRCA